MAPRKTSASPKPDKLMRDALLLELQVDSNIEERGKKLKKLRLVARALVEKAINGDVTAIREINDRIDGRCAAGFSVPVGGNIGNALKIEVEFV